MSGKYARSEERKISLLTSKLIIELGKKSVSVTIGALLYMAQIPGH
jgi:hypothetical protein